MTWSWSYWMVDEHKAGSSGARLVFHEPERVGTVPLGAMLPKGVGHMLVAGRAVSSDHGAKQRRDPRDVSLDLVKKRLAGIGHLVP